MSLGIFTIRANNSYPFTAKIFYGAKNQWVWFNFALKSNEGTANTTAAGLRYKGRDPITIETNANLPFENIGDLHDAEVWIDGIKYIITSAQKLNIRGNNPSERFFKNKNAVYLINLA